MPGISVGELRNRVIRKHNAIWLVILLVLPACQAPTGPEQPSQADATPISIPEIRKYYTTVTKRHYISTRPGYVAIVLSDPDVNSTTEIVSVSYVDIYNRWIRVFWLDVLIVGVRSVQSESIEGREEAFAVLLVDRNRRLLSRLVRIRYSP